MPPLERGLDDGVDSTMLVCKGSGGDGVEATNASTVIESYPRCSVLNEKIVRVSFKENIIIGG